MAASAYFDAATLARGIVPKNSPKKATKAAAPVEAAPAPVIADPKLAAEVEAFRAFEREKIAPLAASVETFPAPAPDRVSVSAFPLFVRASDVAKFRAVSRDIAYYRGQYRQKHLAACFCASLIDNARDEAAALVAGCLNYHDDRGDGLLYVPAFKKRDVFAAWERAAAALGIVTKCRACAR